MQLQRAIGIKQNRHNAGLAGLAVVFVMSFAALQPQAEARLNVSPARTIFHESPGQAIAGSYKVKNLSDATVQFTIQPEKFDKTDAPDPSQWFFFESSQHSIEPGQELEIAYTGTIPDSAEGELALQVYFTTSSAALQKRLGVVIYIPIKGTEVFDVQFRGVEIDYVKDPMDPDAQLIPDRLVVKTNLFNNGNIHVVPTGNVVVFNDAEEQVANFNISGGWGLLPRSQYPYTANGIGIALQPGAYTARINIHFGRDVNMEQVVTHTVPFTVGGDYGIQVTEN